MAFLGMRGDGSWVSHQRPKNWREGILLLFPNGTAPLTAIMSKLKSKSVDDPEFHWWTKTLPLQRATITGVYTDAGLSTAYTSGGVAGDSVYVKMSAADLSQFRIGHQVLLRMSTDYTVDVNTKVVNKSSNGASSYIQCKLLEADDNSTTHDLSDADVALIVGNVNPEGGNMPQALSYDPVLLSNYTQIFRTPLSITRTARKTRLRTGDAYKEAKRECLELHSIEIEKAFILGVKSLSIGDNGQPERTTDGALTIIKNGAPANCDDYTLNTSYQGSDWTTGGADWLNAMLEQMFRYGRKEKLMLCGSGALMGINALAMSGSHYTLTAQTPAYGINVVTWITPVGQLHMLTHPLFSQEPTLRYSGLILEPENLSFNYIDDTNFYSEGTAPGSAPMGSNHTRRDATDEEYLTEAGLELAHPTTMGFLNGIGLDNTLSA